MKFSLGSDDLDFTFGDQRIRVILKRQRRKTIAIHLIATHQPVEVRAPLKCAWRDIIAFVESKHVWIAKNLASLPVERAPVSFDDKSAHYYLGQPYKLSLSSGRSLVRIKHDVIQVSVIDLTNQKKVAEALERFYKKQSEQVFAARLKQCVEQFPIGVIPSGLRVRKMKSRWGSCSHRGEICLNTHLVKHSPEVIDMVIRHELCHLHHFAHNADFYQLMDLAEPNWRSIETKLNRGPISPRQLTLL